MGYYSISHALNKDGVAMGEQSREDDLPFVKIAKWFRTNLLLIIFGCMVLLQYLTWSAISDVRRYLPNSPPDCDSLRPCTVQLTRASADEIGAAVAGRK